MTPSRSASTGEPPKIVSVFGGKGGIGKSTLATLAALLLSKVGPTLLVDADKRQTDGSSKELHQVLGIRASYDIAVEEDATLIGNLRAATDYRFVVVDNGPERDEKKLKASCDADLVIVPMVPVYLETRAVMSSIREIVIPSQRQYRVVMSRVRNERMAKAKTTHESLRAVGIPTFKTFMREYVAHQDAGAMGVPVFEGKGPNWSKAADDAYAFGNEVLEALGLDDRLSRVEAS